MSSVSTSTSLRTNATHFAKLLAGTILYTPNGNVQVWFVACSGVDMTVLSETFKYLTITFNKGTRLSISKQDATLFLDNMLCDEAFMAT
jgi:hypothetical protein